MMLRDALDLVEDAIVEAQVCIAGAGPAGITLARDLAASGVSVCVLEGGGLDLEEDSQALYEGTEVGDYLVGLTSNRARQFGGSTSLWSGFCRRLDPDDFGPREWIPGSGWPIGYRDLEPCYRLAHRTCEIGADEFDAYAVGARIDLPVLPLDPARVQSVLYQFSPPTRFGVRYRADLEAAEQIVVYLHANLVDIRLSTSGDAVAGFACRTLAGTNFRAQADHYVLAMGGIENPRIMLASRSQVAGGIGNANDLVGRYFMEHPHYIGSVQLLARETASQFYRGVHPATTIDRANPEGIPTGVRAALALPAALRARDQLPSLACTLDAVTDTASEVAPEQIQVIMRGTEPGVDLRRLVIRAEQRPLADSRVTLGEELDALGVPRTTIAWRIAQEDIDGVHRSLEHIVAELGRVGIGRVWIQEDENRRFAPASVKGGAHHMGTTRMSASPATGVVDADCRVHGLDNLYAAGSSVFPTGGYANPTLTIVALAHRLAQHLTGRLAS